MSDVAAVAALPSSIVMLSGKQASKVGRHGRQNGVQCSRWALTLAGLHGTTGETSD